MTKPVEDLGQIYSENEVVKKMRFLLKEADKSKTEVNKVAIKWKRKLTKHRAQKMENDQIRQEVMNGSQPSATVDMGAMSSYGQEVDLLMKTGKMSNK